jgi:hypothetical protein
MYTFVAVSFLMKRAKLFAPSWRRHKSIMLVGAALMNVCGALNVLKSLVYAYRI